MTKQSPTIVFFGNERLATGVTTDCLTFKSLLKAGYNIASLILHDEGSSGRKKRLPEIAQVATDNGVPIIYVHKLKEVEDQIKALNAEAAVLVAFGKIIPQSTIDLFPKGIINIHPSKLPEHRGPTPLESIILSGQPETAISIMQLTAAMDAGPVYIQRTLPVPSKITKQELVNVVSKLSSEMLVQHLPAILDGSLQPQTQNHDLATYDQLLTKTSGLVDWTKPAAVLEREVRAYAGWPKSQAQIGNQQVILTECDVINTSLKPSEIVATKKELTVGCGQDSLKILKLQPVNKKEMPIQAFLSGYSL